MSKENWKASLEGIEYIGDREELKAVLTWALESKEEEIKERLSDYLADAMDSMGDHTYSCAGTSSKIFNELKEILCQ